MRAAARQFCRPEGKGSAIADLMRELGLTHGGFYKHFDNKQQLLAEAITKGFEEMEAGNAVKDVPLLLCPRKSRVTLAPYVLKLIALCSVGSSALPGFCRERLGRSGSVIAWF